MKAVLLAVLLGYVSIPAILVLVACCRLTKDWWDERQDRLRAIDRLIRECGGTPYTPTPRKL